LIGDLARSMAQDLTHDVLLMSNEDILGRLPSRQVYATLYGGAISYLTLIQSAFRDAGHDVQFVFYMRTYDDWLHSLYRYTFVDDPERAFAPKRYKQKRNLPDDWTALCTDLSSALGTDGITFVDYQDDRANGRLGTALFKISGMSDVQIDALTWIEPVNVSQAKTVDPANW
jgi:hypothetical protein